MRTIFFHGDRNKKQIAITFDDGPSSITFKILKVLKKENIPATFFIMGKKVNNNKKVLKQMIKQGCEIGNHTYNHTDLNFKSSKVIRTELLDTDRKLGDINIKTKIMRCPHFRFDSKAVSVIKKLKKMMIFVDIDSLDWIKILPMKFIIFFVLIRVRNGSIIGFHDYLEGIGDNKRVVSIVRDVIRKLKKRGYTNWLLFLRCWSFNIIFNKSGNLMGYIFFYIIFF